MINSLKTQKLTYTMSQNLEIIDPTHVTTLADAHDAFDIVINFPHLKIRKIGQDELTLVFRNRKAEMISKLRAMLEIAQQKEALKIWEKCKRSLQFELLMPDDCSISIDLMDNLEIEPKMLAQAFLWHNRLRFPKKTSYSVLLGQYDPEGAERFAELIKQLPTHQREGFIQELNEKVLYLYLSSEYDYALTEVEGAQEQIICSLRSGGPPPLEMALGHCLWEHAHDTYRSSMVSIINGEFSEIREVFWEVQSRTRDWNAHEDQFSKKTLDDIETYLKG